ncbi:MAG: hypothetical protein KDE04_01865 [Anaerolineales bacterium]|nr:hypothetical protein [Anaerolineales bacterium]MCB0010891.1 hypothetical protein [Anaerolineales bacterium]
MNIEIRDITEIADVKAVEQLQMDVWGGDPGMIVPDHLLVTIQKNGGLLLGAFDESGEVVGFVLGFLGLTKEGALKHCSHMAGVHPKVRDANLGYRLKLAQREAVLAQGYDHITWTFDPLESRNANLNFRKLGAVCHTYYRNVYGEMSDEVNAGMPSDRFEVDWWLKDEPVLARLEERWQPPQFAELEDAGVQVINPSIRGDLPRPTDRPHKPAGRRYLIEIPRHIHQIKRWDMALAHAWRLQNRALLEEAFANGYQVTDFIHDQGHSYYLLAAPG